MLIPGGEVQQAGVVKELEGQPEAERKCEGPKGVEESERFAFCRLLLSAQRSCSSTLRFRTLL